MMAHRFIDFLEREYARLDAYVAQLRRQLGPNKDVIARLQAQRRLIRDEIARWRRDLAEAGGQSVVRLEQTLRDARRHGEASS